MVQYAERTIFIISINGINSECGPESKGFVIRGTAWRHVCDVDRVVQCAVFIENFERVLVGMAKEKTCYGIFISEIVGGKWKVLWDHLEDWLQELLVFIGYG